jgi:hypothetical protein
VPHPNSEHPMKRYLGGLMILVGVVAPASDFVDDDLAF